MATIAQGRTTPAHLWIVGILALLWNGYGCYEYLMTMTQNQAHLAQYSAAELAYMNSLPSWLAGAWAFAVWGGAAGALLLLVRSRYAVWAFAISFLGCIVTFGYEIFATEMPAEMSSGAKAIMPWLITAIAAFLLWYSANSEKKGFLR